MGKAGERPRCVHQGRRRPGPRGRCRTSSAASRSCPRHRPGWCSASTATEPARHARDQAPGQRLRPRVLGLGCRPRSRSGVRRWTRRCSSRTSASARTAHRTCPGTTAFWSAVFSTSGRARTEAVSALVTGPPVEFSWLCEQIFTGGQTLIRPPYQLVLFASRQIPAVTASNAREALDALRGASQFPAAGRDAGARAHHPAQRLRRCRAARARALGDRRRTARRRWRWRSSRVR